jgi:hypothetical protein
MTAKKDLNTPLGSFSRRDACGGKIGIVNPSKARMLHVWFSSPIMSMIGRIHTLSTRFEIHRRDADVLNQNKPELIPDHSLVNCLLLQGVQYESKLNWRIAFVGATVHGDGTRRFQKVNVGAASVRSSRNLSLTPRVTPSQLRRN